jgi:hypothetical protein
MLAFPYILLRRQENVIVIGRACLVIPSMGEGGPWVGSGEGRLGSEWNGVYTG